MKRIFIVFACIMFIVIIFAEAKGQESKSKPCEYTGIIKEKSNKGDLITVATNEKGILDFYYKHGEKQGCTPWDGLVKNDRVQITCEEGKNRIEAICIKKMPKQYLPWGQSDLKK